MIKTSEASRWSAVRKRVAPIVFLLALGVLATRTCTADVAQVEVVIDFGAAAAKVRDVRVDVFRDGESQSVAVFTRHWGEGGATEPPRFSAQLDPGSYHLLIEVRMPAATERFERVIEAGDKAEIRVDLGRNLPAP